MDKIDHENRFMNAESDKLGIHNRIQGPLERLESPKEID